MIYLCCTPTLFRVRSHVSHHGISENNSTGQEDKCSTFTPKHTADPYTTHICAHKVGPVINTSPWGNNSIYEGIMLKSSKAILASISSTEDSIDMDADKS